MASTEATPEQASQWSARYGDGYSAGRGDARSEHSARPGALVGIPAELPGESGAEYVARCLPLAWRIGYTRAWQHARPRPGERQADVELEAG